MFTTTMMDSCPRCHHKLAPERMTSIPAVCDGCGMVLSVNEETVQKQVQSTSLKWIVGSSVGLALMFMHLANWGSYSLEVLPIKAAQVLSMDSPTQAQRMALICMDLHKHDCVEDNYRRLSLHDITWLSKLAKFQFNRMKYAESAETYLHFFARGGQDLDSTYWAARALSEVGRVDEAAKYFDVVLGSKPGVLQITVAQNYVKMLRKAGRLEQARSVIESIQNQDESVKTFMASEHKEIVDLMKSSG
ncbi:MAG: hypothetical protein HC902_01520 [Calothrix sp. SM1_5_4]|nr:hypothetical protein [Calothrix sp. SM1_5_4]